MSNLFRFSLYILSLLFFRLDSFSSFLIHFFLHLVKSFEVVVYFSLSSSSSIHCPLTITGYIQIFISFLFCFGCIDNHACEPFTSRQNNIIIIIINAELTLLAAVIHTHLKHSVIWWIEHRTLNRYPNGLIFENDCETHRRASEI